MAGRCAARCLLLVLTKPSPPRPPLTCHGILEQVPVSGFADPLGAALARDVHAPRVGTVRGGQAHVLLAERDAGEAPVQAAALQLAAGLENLPVPIDPAVHLAAFLHVFNCNDSPGARQGQGDGEVGMAEGFLRVAGRGARRRGAGWAQVCCCSPAAVCATLHFPFPALSAELTFFQSSSSPVGEELPALWLCLRLSGFSDLKKFLCNFSAAPQPPAPAGRLVLQHPWAHPGSNHPENPARNHCESWGSSTAPRPAACIILNGAVSRSLGTVPGARGVRALRCSQLQVAPVPVL